MAGLNAAAAQILVDKGLSAQDIVDVMIANEKKADNTAAERQARYRAKRKQQKSRRNSNGVTPPIESIHTPSDNSSDDECHSPASDAGTVLEKWSAVAKPLRLSCWEKLTPKRRKLIEARIRDHGLEPILLAIERVPKSGFLRGERGDWNGANLDFLTRPDTVPSILEGKYDDRERSSAVPSTGTTRRGGSLADIGNEVRELYAQ